MIVTFSLTQGILYGSVETNCSQLNKKAVKSIEFKLKTKIYSTGTSLAKQECNEIQDHHKTYNTRSRHPGSVAGSGHVFGERFAAVRVKTSDQPSIVFTTEIYSGIN